MVHSGSDLLTQTNYTRNTYLAISLAKLGLVTALKLSPLKGPYVVLSFLLLLFCVLCGVIVNSVLKTRCSIISAPGFRKRPKQRTNLVRPSSPENYYSSGRNTELKLCRLSSTYIGGDGFRTVNDHNASGSNLLFLCLLLSALPSLC